MRKFAQNSQKTLNDPKLYIHPKNAFRTALQE